MTVAGLAAAALLGSCGGSDGRPEIDDARVGQPTGPNAAMYFTATAGGQADRLVRAETAAAAMVEIHETTAGDDGTMGMRAVDGLDLPADGTLVFEPGGFHLMLIDSARLEVGDIVQVTLTWENAGEMVVAAEVVEPAETMTP